MSQDKPVLSDSMIEEWRGRLRSIWLPGLTIEESQRRAEALCDLALSALDRQGWIIVPREPTMGQWDDFCAIAGPVPFGKFQAAYRVLFLPHTSEPASGSPDVSTKEKQ